MDQRARAITASRVLALLFVFSLALEAQDTPTYTTNYRFRKWNEGQYPSADSVKKNWDNLDSLLNISGGVSYLQFVPFYTEAATGSAWAGADNAVNVFPFTLTVPMTPDSAVVFLSSNANTGDSIKFAIYNYTGTTKQFETGWASPAATASNQRVAAAFSSPTRLPAGTYLMAYGVRNMVANSPIPTTTIVSSTLYLTGAQGAGGTRRIGSELSGLSAGSFPASLTLGALSPSNVPVIILVGE